MKFTKASRAVLADVTLVRAILEDEVNTAQWRLHWILSVVLLRAVGHVLDKVDGRSNAEVRKTANEMFKQWKTDDKHRIFNQFIDLERNSILKEYETQMSEGPVPIIVKLLGPGNIIKDEQFFIDENIYRPVVGGFYSGEDGRTLIDEALTWWTEQLDEIDRRVQYSHERR
ncbi:hypothetical protein [Massilia oculi]|uniref:hypothetical protein n=1 Tax=Massilia oculi TaxID=945844 RepID=UPI001AAEB523|nr:hypothetical protein [Massilia oculi]